MAAVQSTTSGRPAVQRVLPFCDHFRASLRTAEPVMRFEIVPETSASSTMPDQTADVIDRSTGDRQAQIFVAVLGCSNYPPDNEIVGSRNVIVVEKAALTWKGRADSAGANA
jgi:hypothetical protein